jgi:hypothetical protein
VRSPRASGAQPSQRRVCTLVGRGAVKLNALRGAATGREELLRIFRKYDRKSTGTIGRVELAEVRHVGCSLDRAGRLTKAHSDGVRTRRAADRRRAQRCDGCHGPRHVPFGHLHEAHWALRAAH